MRALVKLSGILAVAMFAAFQAQAVVTLVDDNFNRGPGSLIDTFPTPGPGGVWTNHSGTSGDLLLNGAQAVVQHGVPSEDAHTMFADQTAGVLVADFDITVSSGSPISGGDYEYFAHFMQEGTFAFLSRAYVVPVTAGGDYSLGLSTTSGGFTTQLTQDFSYGVTNHVTLTFDFGTGISSMTVGAETIYGNAIALGDTLNSFALRQSDSSNNETILVDNLVVTIPEPTTFALVGVGLLGLLTVRRRRK